MKHIIWTPVIDEVIPDGSIFYQWGEQVTDAEGVTTIPNPVDVVACLVQDDFTTPGTVIYDSSSETPPPFSLIHTFFGW